MANKTRGTFASPGNFEVQIKAPIDSRLQACLYTDLISADYWKSIDDSVYLYKGLVVPVTSGSAIDLYMLTGDPTTAPTCYQSYANWKKIGSESDIFYITNIEAVETGSSPLLFFGETATEFNNAFLAGKIFVSRSVTGSTNQIIVCNVIKNQNLRPTHYIISYTHGGTYKEIDVPLSSSSVDNWGTTCTVTTKTIADKNSVVNSVAATANKGIEIAGTATVPTIGIKLDTGGSNVSLSTGANGLKASYEDFATGIDATDQVLTANATKLKANLDLQYDSGTKQIKLLGKSDAVIATIDATDFIKDGMVQNVELSGNNLVITFNTDAGTEAISVDLSKFLDVYTNGNGISISGKSIAVKPYMGIVVDSNGVAVNVNSGDKYLGFSGGALVSKGIDAAIESMITEALKIHDVE